MKCKTCEYDTNEVFNTITGNQKTTSILYCSKCGTLYLGTPATSNFINDIPSNAIYKDGFVYILLQSTATLKYLEA